MFTQKHELINLSGEELDDYLAGGWYRMGQSVFTCHFLFFEGNLYSPIWTRISLRGYHFRKTLRRLLSSNGRMFQVVVRQANIDEEKEELYSLYRLNFKGNLPLTLIDSMNDGSDVNVFNTKETAIYDGDTLIAFSFFDLGKSAIASIKGIYHPDYASHSLGLYTMLLEMKYGIEQGFEHFYPGYIVPGYSRFDYKLRIGFPSEIEYFDVQTKSWEPYRDFNLESSPVKKIMKKLAKITHSKLLNQVELEVLFYPAYEANIFGYDLEPYLESPLFINCFKDLFDEPRFIVFYDIWKESYVFCHCLTKEDFSFYLAYSVQFESQQSNIFHDFLLKKSVIIETTDIVELAKWIKLIKGLIELSFNRQLMK